MANYVRLMVILIFLHCQIVFLVRSSDTNTTSSTLATEVGSQGNDTQAYSISIGQENYNPRPAFVPLEDANATENLEYGKENYTASNNNTINKILKNGTIQSDVDKKNLNSEDLKNISNVASKNISYDFQNTSLHEQYVLKENSTMDSFVTSQINNTDTISDTQTGATSQDNLMSTSTQKILKDPAYDVKPHGHTLWLGHGHKKARPIPFSHHLHLVPMEDEPFGSVIWRDERYLVSVLIPIGIGVGGAAAIVMTTYTLRCLAQRRRQRELLQNQQSVSGISRIKTERTDQIVLLADSTDDEI